MRRQHVLSFARPLVAALAFMSIGTVAIADNTVTLREGAVITLTREAVLNGVTLPKGSTLKIASVKKAPGGELRVDVEQVGGEHRTFKALTPEAIGAMTATSNVSVPSGDSSQVFKVGAQIPLLHDVVLNDLTFQKGSALQVDKVLRDAKGKVVKVDLRETSGKTRLVKGVAVDQLMLALAPDEVTWPDGAVGVNLHLARELRLGEVTFPKGTHFVVTHVQPASNGKGVVRVGLREVEGQKRQFDNISVAVLKQSGALGTAEGAVK